MKEKIILGVGFVAIILVAALIVNGNNQCHEDQVKAAEATTEMLLQQKDGAIVKLIKHIKTRDEALVIAKAQLGAAETRLNANAEKLEGAIKKIDTIKDEVNTPIGIETSSKK